jgi:hypothetical protein
MKIQSSAMHCACLWASPLIGGCFSQSGYENNTAYDRAIQRDDYYQDAREARNAEYIGGTSPWGNTILGVGVGTSGVEKIYNERAVQGLAYPPTQ